VQLLRTTTGSGVSTTPKARSAAGPTTVGVLTVLLPGTGSDWLPETVEVVTIVPCAVGVTAMVPVARAPAARLPRLKATRLPLMVVKPCDALAFWTMTLKGSVFVTLTPEACDGPLFVTEML